MGIIHHKDISFIMRPGLVSRLKRDIENQGNPHRCGSDLEECSGNGYGVLVMRTGTPSYLFPDPIVIRCYGCIKRIFKDHYTFIDLKEFQSPPIWDHLESLEILSQ
jgi:hypothetical protein